ncbi:hypothetical protein QR680_017887 [Steinernema hermaphroditum]|uniref:Nuclear receptor domain-containing protein n=1 Tax=Steinernema hermaphroditum TaxID=289476 RepID=A0AA39HIE6_9BILA|nr:hypothetical protein QR680_017887 [Steinernema hermaphroditum]
MIHHHHTGDCLFAIDYFPACRSGFIAGVMVDAEERVRTSAIGRCAVCGAPAKCLHYDAVTCSGCKNFFRRSLVEGRRYVCAREGLCVISEDNRLFCKACRLAKCFIAGMNANAIQLDSDDSRKKMHVQLSRSRTMVDYRGRCQQIVPPNVIVVEDACNKLIESLLFFENRCNRVRLSTFDPAKEELQHKDIEYLLRTPFRFGDVSKLEIPMNWPSNQVMPRSFEDFALKSPFIKQWFLLDMVLAVEFSKTLGGFQIIPIEEQKEILKTALITNRLFAEAFFSFQVNSDSIVFPDGVKPLDLLKYVMTDIYIECFKNVMEPLIRYKPSKQEYVICKAIIALNAECPNISRETSEILDAARKQYTDVLLRLCQRENGDVGGAVRFGNLMGLIQTMHAYGEKFNRLRTLFLLYLRSKLPQRKPSKLAESLFNVA